MKVSFAEAVRLIKAGELIAIPTETVYGLAAPISQPKSLKKIYAIKGRPSDNPLIVHISKPSQLKKLVKNIPSSFSRIKHLWPGPLTIVFDANLKTIPSAVRAGLKTVAIRMPDHPLTLALIDKTGPLAAPSANLSGKPSPTRRIHVEEDFGKIFPVLDGGVCLRGVESTVIRLNKNSWELLREGAVSAEEIQKHLKLEQVDHATSKKPQSPGQKYRHYAPLARLTLCDSATRLKRAEKQNQIVLGFDETETTLEKISLGSKKNPGQNLRRLYEALRRLDREGFKKVLVDCDFSHAGLGSTLVERLIKAAGKDRSS
jgi:L-threonylcarbamoyladenylate synthase